VPFPTVKSNPYARPRPRRRRPTLWPPSGWKRLCEAARLDFFRDGVRTVGDRAFAVICELNGIDHG
jgi:hypothetical protein